MSAIIQVKDLSKSFIISHEGQERYTALRDVVTNKAKKLFSFSKPAIASEKNTATKEEFWALKDLNFEIEKGDRVGIIGRNGAGKSTLLKILSRITEPTSGEIRIKGRVASLLEVGTGFHPELTGRENIFLNGAILGMSRAEIRKKFDEIVAFAEVEKFLDTPVKRYSSGMYVRLAFAVAAHLEPEILVVDEVLAVGDAQFQKKCLGKMEDVSKNEGRTVLFVSHNMAAIRNLCKDAILINNGKLIKNGNANDIINYFENNLPFDKPNYNDHYKREFIQLNSFAILSKDLIPTYEIQTGDNICFEINFQSVNKVMYNDISVGIALESISGNFELINYSHFTGKTFAGNSFLIRGFLNELPIGIGNYKIHLRITNKNEELFWNKNICLLTVQRGDFFGTGVYGEDILCTHFHKIKWQNAE